MYWCVQFKLIYKNSFNEICKTLVFIQYQKTKEPSIYIIITSFSSKPIKNNHRNTYTLMHHLWKNKLINIKRLFRLILTKR